MSLNGNPFGDIMDSGRRRPTDIDPPEKDTNYMNEVLERMRRDAFTRTALDDDDSSNVPDDDWATFPYDEDKSSPQPIEVETCKFYANDNAKSHHTQSYELLYSKKSSPVLRRGLPFDLTVRFNRPFKTPQDIVEMELSLGPKKVTGKGNFLTLRITTKTKFTRDASKWDIRLISQEKSTLNFQIQIPYTASVGFWTIMITSKIPGERESKTYSCKENIYILFNPWAREDPVYMEDDLSRQEYVLNDVGKLYTGDHRRPGGRPWIFGQFQTVVLTASMYLLEKSGIDFMSRGDPIHVSRAISAMVNENNGGVVAGKWSDDYKDGISPLAWTGSVAILKKYLKNGGKSVKWGQCWVFSGVFTTISRSLGIPCRSVTNYNSAVDHNDNLSVDTFYDADGRKLYINQDSIWNYHVWNECWMTRPDLPEGYGGWQALDGNPREETEVPYRTGPASVLAIKRREFQYPFDTKYIYSEINSDVIDWLVDKLDEFGYKKKKLRRDSKHVGKLIVTKKVGVFDESRGAEDIEDITSTYKSEEEAPILSVEDQACLSYDGIELDFTETPDDISFKLRDFDKIMIGKKFKVIVDIENKSDENRTATLVLSVNSVYYTGDIARKIKRIKEAVILKPQEKKEFGIEVTVDDYLNKLVDFPMVNISAISSVQETKQIWIGYDVVMFETPSLTLEIEGQLKMDHYFNLKISFTNPLKQTLENCRLMIEGTGIAEPALQISLNDIGPEKTFTHVETLTPTRSGPRRVIAMFWSRELREVFGSKEVPVEDYK